MRQSAEPLLSRSTKNLTQLIETIYSAVDDASLWPIVLEQLSVLVRGQEILLWTDFSGSEGANILCSARMDPASLLPYAEHYGSVNILAERCDRMYKDGQIRYSNRAVPDLEFEKTEFFNDYFNPNGMYHSFGVKMPLGDQPAPYLACMRPKHKKPFDEVEGSLLERAVPHLQRALRLHLEFTQLRSKVEGLTSALDAFDHAVFGLNRNGKVIFSNREAEQLAQAGDGIKLSNGILTATQPGDGSRLQSQLRAAIATGTRNGTSAGGSLLLNRKSGGSPLCLTVTPFLSDSLLGNYGEVAALVFVVDPARRPVCRSNTLRALYRLAPTESRIVDALADGLDIGGISERAGLTRDTVRFYLKAVFRKTGVNRQSELMKLILRLPAT